MVQYRRRTEMSAEEIKNDADEGEMTENGRCLK